MDENEPDARAENAAKSPENLVKSWGKGETTMFIVVKNRAQKSPERQAHRALRTGDQEISQDVTRIGMST